MIPAILGGIGLFLLGMVLLTEGLKTAAGDALRQVLSRFTGGPLQAFLSGAGATVLVQSSSATILATIGFVSAGLLSFTQSVGVIFGAATGTTSTGWIVSLLGLRWQISAVALPLVGVGALMRLLLHGRRAALGLAFAGFGLIFIGIDTLQSGMQTLGERMDPAMFPGATVAGRVLLVALGVMMTVVMQSSSAAVATTLAALHGGTIHLEQAALLVVGQNMGTAITAALASIGAAVAAKRTALAHVLFNTFAGILGLLLVPLFVALAQRDAPLSALDGAIAIAAFHTGFNLLAVAILLPLIGSFAALVVRLLPDRGPVLTRHLDASVAEVAPVGVEAARRTTIETGAVIVAAACRLLRRELGRHELDRELEPAGAALAETRHFLGAVRTSRSVPLEHRRHLAVLHALDHFDRMVEALRAEDPRHVVLAHPRLQQFASELAKQLTTALRWLRGELPEAPLEEVRRMSRLMAETRRDQRPRVMTETAAGNIDPETALAQLDAMRWLDRLAYHTWRALEHLGSDDGSAEPGAAVIPAESDADERE
jgi:phosphate:Na+ symporter